MNKHYHHAIGKVIKAARLTDEDKLVLTFEDDSTLTASDEGQDCCEERYMRTDDNLDDLVGCKLLDFEIKDAPSVAGDYDIHEIQFLEVKTDKGCVTMASHNEHNGYYGGFAIRFLYKEGGMTDDQFKALCNTFGFAPSRALREMLGKAMEQERESCAKLCEELDKKSADGEWGDYLAGWFDGTDDCAAAIRARGQS